LAVILEEDDIMISRIGLTLILIVIFLACSNGITPQQAKHSLDYADPSQNTDPFSTRNITDALTVNNAWSPTTTIQETETNATYSGDISLASNALGSIFASWEISSTLALYTRSSISTPWQTSGPDSSHFNIIISPELYSNSQSNTVIATWFSPDQNFSTHFVSRYTLESG